MGTAITDYNTFCFTVRCIAETHIWWGEFTWASTFTPLKENPLQDWACEAPRWTLYLHFVRRFQQENGLLACQHTPGHLHVPATPPLWWEPQRHPETSPHSLMTGWERPGDNLPLGGRNYSSPVLRGLSPQKEKAGWYREVGGNEKQKDKFNSLDSSGVGDLGRGPPNLYGKFEKQYWLLGNSGTLKKKSFVEVGSYSSVLSVKGSWKMKSMIPQRLKELLSQKLNSSTKGV